VITALAGGAGGGLLLAPDVYLSNHRQLIMALAARLRLPAIFGFRQFVRERALISYGGQTPSTSSDARLAVIVATAGHASAGTVTLTGFTTNYRTCAAIRVQSNQQLSLASRTQKLALFG
jgi:hypothetical protein